MTLGAFVHKLYAIPFDGRPVITNYEDFGSHCPCTRVTATYPLVDLLEDVFNLVFGDAFQQRR